MAGSVAIFGRDLLAITFAQHLLGRRTEDHGDTLSVVIEQPHEPAPASRENAAAVDEGDQHAALFFVVHGTP